MKTLRDHHPLAWNELNIFSSLYTHAFLKRSLRKTIEPYDKLTLRTHKRSRCSAKDFLMNEFQLMSSLTLSFSPVPPPPFQTQRLYTLLF